MKPDIVKYIRKLKKLFLLSGALLIAAALVFVVLGIGVSRPYLIGAALFLAGFVAALALYLSKVKYSLVYELTFSGGVITVQVKGGVYTFAPENVARAKFDGARFILYFDRDGDREKFVFLRRIPFDRFRTEQFREKDIAEFFPQIAAGRADE